MPIYRHETAAPQHPARTARLKRGSTREGAQPTIVVGLAQAALGVLFVLRVPQSGATFGAVYPATISNGRQVPLAATKTTSARSGSLARVLPPNSRRCHTVTTPSTCGGALAWLPARMWRGCSADARACGTASGRSRHARDPTACRVRSADDTVRRSLGRARRAAPTVPVIADASSRSLAPSF